MESLGFIYSLREPYRERFQVVGNPRFAECKVEPDYRPGTILARNSDELDHVEDEKDEADGLASLLVFVGVAGWPKHHICNLHTVR